MGPQGTASFEYDLADRRTKLTYPGTGLYVNTDYLVTSEVSKIRENGATSGVGVLATYAYDDLGSRTSVTFGNGVVQSYSYDPVSRLASLTNDLAGTANDLTVSGIAYNPASQITSLTRSNDAYAWTGHGSGSTAYVQNGLNQQTSIGGAAASWDSKGNLTTEPQSGKTYGYSSENLLTSASGGVTLGYDPLLRLYQVAGAATMRFAYDGLNAIAEHNGSNVLQRRFVFGPGIDEPIVQYEGAGTTDRRFLSSDERGSIIALTDSSGALLGINAYDEYGKPGAANTGRFQYTGQKWIGEIGGYDYKNRVYLPHIGIFPQADPIRYEGGINLYAYVLNDPVNLVDPFGLQGCPDRTDTAIDGSGGDGGCGDPSPEEDIVITGTRLDISVDVHAPPTAYIFGIFDLHALYASIERQIVFPGERTPLDEIVITAWRKKELVGVPLEWDLPAYQEQRWLAYPRNRIVYIGIAEGKLRPDGTVEITVPNVPGIDAIIHTHPDWSFVLPGSGDYGHNVPIYGLTKSGAWVVQPGDPRGSRPTCLIGRC